MRACWRASTLTTPCGIEAKIIIAQAGDRAKTMTMAQAFDLRTAQCLHEFMVTRYFSQIDHERIYEDDAQIGDEWVRLCVDCNAHLDGDII